MVAQDQNPKPPTSPGPSAPSSKPRLKRAIAVSIVTLATAFGIYFASQRAGNSPTSSPQNSLQADLDPSSGPSGQQDALQDATQPAIRGLSSATPPETSAPSKSTTSQNTQAALEAKPLKDPKDHDGQKPPAAAPPSREPSSAAVAVAPSGCFEETFAHKKLSSHADGEACLQHQNLITLSVSNALLTEKARKSLCVRVNGKPVKFTVNPEATPDRPAEILIAALAGPESTIRVRYCLGKDKCQGKDAGCAVPKDDFLANLGAAAGMTEDFDDVTAGAPNAAWGSGKHAKDERQAQAQVDRQLASAKKIFEAARRGKASVFKDWLIQGAAEAACQFKH